MSKFVPSIQQQNFFNWIQNGEGSCILEAVAGSGKTTTLIQGIDLMDGDIFFGAFNKAIQLEIAAKVNKPVNEFPDINQHQQRLMDKLKELGFGVSFIADNKYVPDAFRDDDGNGPEYQNHVIQVSW